MQSSSSGEIRLKYVFFTLIENLTEEHHEHHAEALLMSPEILRDDALSSTGSGFQVRLSMPWIRSLPLRSLTDLTVTIDGDRVPKLHLVVGDRHVTEATINDESTWWFIQDRVVVGGTCEGSISGAHDVTVSFHLVIPYLRGGRDGPLSLPFNVECRLTADAPASYPTVSRDVA